MENGREQDRVWETLVRRQRPQVEAFACREYLEGLAILSLPEDRVPSLQALNASITPRTGWRLRRTPGRSSPAFVSSPFLYSFNVSMCSRNASSE